MYRTALTLATLCAGLVAGASLRPAGAAEVVPEQRLLGSPSDGFASAVAARDGLLVVGAPDAPDGGAVHVYERSEGGGGPWVETAVLNGSPGEFGSAVAVEAGRIVVGAEEAGPGGGAQVFEPDGAGGWTVVATLVAPPGVSTFGDAVALDGDTAVVRSGSADVFGPDPGDPDGWLHVAELVVPGIAPHDELGLDVDVDGDIAVASAFGADPLAPESGAAHLFERLAGEWTHVAELLPADGGEDERFGDGVAVSGDTVAVGSLRHDHGVGSGAVFVFERDPNDPSGWSQAAELLPPDDETHWVGRSVALDGDRLIAGADGSDTVVFYERPPGDPTGWSAVGKFDIDDGQLGWSVDLDGDVAVAGAPSADVAGDFSGAAYVIERGAGGWDQVQMLVPSGYAEDDRFGTAVAVAGDLIAVNSDRDHEPPVPGRVHVFLRQGDGAWAEIGSFRAPDGEPGDGFGTSAALTANRLFVGSVTGEPGEAAGSAYVFEVP